MGFGLVWRAWLARVVVSVVAFAAVLVWPGTAGTAGDVAGRAGSAVAVPATVTATVMATVTVAAPHGYAEDSLPDELDRWIDAHPGADLWGPGRADALAPGESGCYAAVTSVAWRVMCPGGYRADG